MRLRRWLDEHRLTEAQFSVVLKVDRSLVHRWVRGARPSENHLIEIFRVTNGAVSPNDFYELPRLRPQAELVGAK